MSYLSKVLHLAILKRQTQLAFIKGIIVGVGIMLLIFILINGDL